MSVARLVRAGLGIAVIGVLGFVVMGWWNEYKTAPRPVPTASSETSASTVPSSTVSGPAVVKMTGVNFRTKPSSSAKLIRGMKEGEEVTVLLKEGDWYKVTDSKGKTGWVTATGGYVVLTEEQ